MQTSIYNTLGGELQNLQTQTPDKLTFYHCGPTVYWTQHIGNMRGMTMADLIRRALIYSGYEVTFVRNYTDVGHLTGDNIGDADSGEDRMAKGAKREGLSPDAIADKYIAQFESDTALLNILPPDHSPRATHYIKQMQELVQILLEKGYAYTTDSAVYFDVAKFPNYTDLSGQKLNENRKGAGQGDVQDPDKHNSADFSLWFFKTGPHASALQTWESPFKSKLVENGRGFPGWHIECSAMAKALLGNTIDIHMGGVEHISIHHTNEIAQSEAANGQKFVNYWLHNEHLNVDNKKMAKSEGTAYSVSEIVEKGFSPTALRYFFLGAHYRSKQNFTWEALTGAKNALTKLQKQLRGYLPAAETQGSILEVWRAKFAEALTSDFNVPQALAVLWDMLASDAEPADKLETAYDFDRVLGLNLRKDLEAAEQRNGLSKVDEDKVALLITARERARADKDWAGADQLRDQLLEEFNVEVKDGPSGPEWEVKA